MIVKIDELKDLELLNNFYKIKCNAIVVSEHNENLVALVCTIHEKCYYIGLYEYTKVVEIEDIDDVYARFGNNYRMMAYEINKELILKKDHTLFNCNFFRIQTLMKYMMYKIPMLENKNYETYPQKPVVEILEEMFKERR